MRNNVVLKNIGLPPLRFRSNSSCQPKMHRAANLVPCASDYHRRFYAVNALEQMAGGTATEARQNYLDLSKWLSGSFQVQCAWPSSKCSVNGSFFCACKCLHEVLAATRALVFFFDREQRWIFSICKIKINTNSVYRCYPKTLERGRSTWTSIQARLCLD